MLKLLLFQTTKIQNFETNSQRTNTANCYWLTVSDHKDTKFWNQFTTNFFLRFRFVLLFQTTKIQNFETNSQPTAILINRWEHCFRPQRYKILKPIHNNGWNYKRYIRTVSDHKDTKFWNQFTTVEVFKILNHDCFRPQRYKILKPIHNTNGMASFYYPLFQTTKIQNFETNSQHPKCRLRTVKDCFRPQRYKILKPIHNEGVWNCGLHQLFQTTKIQNFETNSQLQTPRTTKWSTVSDHKDTNNSVKR